MKRDNGGDLMAGSDDCENSGCRQNFADNGGESANHQLYISHIPVTVLDDDHSVTSSLSSQGTPAWSEPLRQYLWTRFAFNRRSSHQWHVSWLFVVWCLCVIYHVGSEARVYDVTSPEGKCIFVLSILIRGYLLECVVGFTGFTALSPNVFKVRKFREMRPLRVYDYISCSIFRISPTSSLVKYISSHIYAKIKESKTNSSSITTNKKLI